MAVASATDPVVTRGAASRRSSRCRLSVGAAAMNRPNAIHALGFGGIRVTGPNSNGPSGASAPGLQAPDRLAGFLFAGLPLDEPRSQPRPDPGGYVLGWTGEVKEQPEP
jgi:hypothetical protein